MFLAPVLYLVHVGADRAALVHQSVIDARLGLRVSAGAIRTTLTSTVTKPLLLRSEQCTSSVYTGCSGSCFAGSISDAGPREEGACADTRNGGRRASRCPADAARGARYGQRSEGRQSLRGDACTSDAALSRRQRPCRRGPRFTATGCADVFSAHRGSAQTSSAARRFRVAVEIQDAMRAARLVVEVARADISPASVTGTLRARDTAPCC